MVCKIQNIHHCCLLVAHETRCHCNKENNTNLLYVLCYLTVCVTEMNEKCWIILQYASPPDFCI